VPSFKPAAAATAADAVTADTGLTIHRVSLGAVIAAGTAAFAWSIAELIQHPVVGSTWFVLLGLTIVTGWSTLRMRHVPISFSISDTFTIAAALLFGPAAGTVVVVIDALVMSLRIALEPTDGGAVRYL
jgi:hypothetical protein